uniref:Uncharacterized protein n=1 Tax=Rhizophora mucronata TaxID=61149 RepID=A0A2P2J075_RHIMU
MPCFNQKIKTQKSNQIQNSNSYIKKWQYFLIKTLCMAVDKDTHYKPKNPSR